MAKNKVSNNGVTNLNVETLIKQASVKRNRISGKLVTHQAIGKMFIRNVLSRGKRYQQVCRHFYDEEGRRHLEIARLEWPTQD